MDETKRTGCNEVTFQEIPSGPAKEKSADIFDHLAAFEPSGGEANLGDFAIDHGAPIGNANQTAADDGIYVRVHDGRHKAEQSFAFDNRIGVHRAKERATAHIQTGVEGFCFAAIFLGQHKQTWDFRIEKISPWCLRRYSLAVDEIHAP